MRTHTTAAVSALLIALCTFGVASADEVPPEFQNRPGPAACYNAVPTYVVPGPNMVTVTGGGNDVILGTPWADEIWAGAGNDIILGMGGDDVIHGGDDNDLICAGTGNDKADGDRADDTVYGEPGNDRLRGGDGMDLLSGDLNSDGGDGEAGFDFCTASTEVQVSC
ncbi:calcium-binding protein [Lentzea sp. NPDC051838]|uniref:calcium-binding protein n=1 Tax=Lentzea sp. NPDC051838 TaxID=3154849 RepID=UPI0034327181